MAGEVSPEKFMEVYDFIMTDESPHTMMFIDLHRKLFCKTPRKNSGVQLTEASVVATLNDGLLFQPKGAGCGLVFLTVQSLGWDFRTKQADSLLTAYPSFEPCSQSVQLDRSSSIRLSDSGVEPRSSVCRGDLTNQVDYSLLWANITCYDKTPGGSIEVGIREL